MSYTSNRVFKIWAYSVSHSTLLLRSTNDEEDEVKAMSDGFNIDIEFSWVGYLDLPRKLSGVSIEELKENIPEKFSQYTASLGYRVFKINSDKTYYIVAGNYVVGKNNWLNEDRILNAYLDYDEIIATSDSDIVSK
jgi:hypothetical protein